MPSRSTVRRATRRRPGSSSSSGTRFGGLVYSGTSDIQRNIVARAPSASTVPNAPPAQQGHTMIRHVLRRTFVPAIIVAVAVALAISSSARRPAAAEPNVPVPRRDRADARWSARDPAAILPPHSDSSSVAATRRCRRSANKAAIDAYLEQHVVIGNGDVTWPIAFDEATLFYSDLAEQDDNYTVVEFTVDTGDVEIPVSWKSRSIRSSTRSPT